MSQSLIRHTLRLTAGLAALLLTSAATFGSALAQTTVDAESPAATISTATTSVQVPITITRSSSTPVLGFSVDFTVSGDLSLPSGTASITEGGFLLADGGTTSFQIIDHGSGNYTADGVTLGAPCGSSALTGTLLSVEVASAIAAGSGTVTITSVTLRDCSNAPLAATIGTTATVDVDNTLPAVAVTAPNGAEFWVVGSSQNISWTATDNDAIDAAGIDLEYSTNNGGSWTSIAANLGNSGTYAWTIPNDASAQSLVRVTARDVNGNSAQDASDAVFTIGYTVTIDDVTVLEGAGTAQFTVSLNAPVSAGQTVTVDYTTANGTAEAPGDFDAITTTTLTFLATESSKPVVVTINDDNIDEPVEDYTVNLSNPSALASITTATGDGTIIDDDDEPTVTLAVDKAALAEDGSDNPATFTATLSNPTTQAITVDLAFSGTATLNDDYTRSGAQISIPALSLTGTATVSAVQDAIDEADETVVVDIDAVSAGATENGTQQATVTITDDDATPTVSLSVLPATLAEDGSDSPATITAALSGQSAQAITVDLAFSGSATLTDDYTRSGTQITIPALSLSGTATVSAVQDAIDEADETVVVDIDVVSAGATENGTQQVTITILDDDNAPSLTIDDVTLAEGDAGTTNFGFTVTLSAPSGQTVTVDFATADGSAVAPGDYTAIPTTQLTFLPGVTTQPVDVLVGGDTDSEPDQTFTVNLTNAVNATIATATGTGTILNDDALGDLAAAQQTSGNDTDGTTKIALTFTAPSGAAAVEVYRAGYGSYPEYDDNGGAVPPAPGAHPPAGPWTLTSVTASGQTDEPAARDFYYYVVYTQNGGGGWSPPSNVTAGTLNYHLGDVSDGVTPGQGNNTVFTEDISLLGSNYGLVLGASDPVGYLDVGPTGDFTVNALPTTDNVLNFEDLVVFAINYDLVSAPHAALEPAAAGARSNELVVRAPGHVSAGEIEVELSASGNGLVQALSVELAWDPAVVAPAGFTAGALIDAQNGIVLSARPGVLDAALLGRGRAGLTGEGTIATLRFRVLAEGDPRIHIAAVDARDGANHKVTMAASSGVIPRPVPSVTTLSGAVPNPTRGSASIVFGLARGGQTEVALYSVDGRRVRTLARGFHEAGEYRMEWDGRDDAGRALAPGAYFIRLDAPGAQFTRKLTFLR